MLTHNRKRLLLIDDSRDNLEILTVLLEGKYDVHCFDSGDEALAALPRVRPDLLLVDVRMFPIDGIEFLTMVRSKKEFSRIPAIAVTALAREVERQAFSRAGFEAIITKPILDLAHVEAVVSRLLESRAAVAESSQASASARMRRRQPIDREGECRQN